MLLIIFGGIIGLLALMFGVIVGILHIVKRIKAQKFYRAVNEREEAQAKLIKEQYDLAVINFSEERSHQVYSIND